MNNDSYGNWTCSHSNYLFWLCAYYRISAWQLGNSFQNKLFFRIIVFYDFFLLIALLLSGNKFQLSCFILRLSLILILLFFYALVTEAHFERSTASRNLPCNYSAFQKYESNSARYSASQSYLELDNCNETNEM